MCTDLSHDRGSEHPGSGPLESASSYHGHFMLTCDIPMTHNNDAGLGAGAAAKVRCTALVGGAESKKVFTAPHVDAAVSTTVAMVTPATGSPAAAAANVGALSSSGLSTTVVGGFAYVSGAAGIKSDGTDVFADIEASLVAAGYEKGCNAFWVSKSWTLLGPCSSTDNGVVGASHQHPPSTLHSAFLFRHV